MNDKNLPPLPEGVAVPEFLEGDRWFDADIEADWLDFSEEYRPPRYTLERDGVGFADVGDLHVITGKAGHGKTGLASQIMATILGGEFGRMRYALKERPEPVLLYVDTEQGKDDTIALKNRVCTLARLDYTRPQERFRILRLRETDDAAERWRKILKAIYVVRPTDIFLDGMLDIVRDYNDQVECQPVVRKCMKVATEYDASLWAVLHENPLVEKLVGTLGSIVQRKVSEIFAVRKVKQADLKGKERRADLPDIYFQVKQLKARGRDVADWFFEYRTDTGGWGMPSEIDGGDAPEAPTVATVVATRKVGTKHTVEELKAWIAERQDAIAWPATRMEFAKGVLEASGVADGDEQRTLTQMAINARLVLLTEGGDGRTNRRLDINRELIPF